MKALTPGQQRRLDGVIDGMGWDGRTITSGRFVRLLDPEGARGVSSHIEVALINLTGEATKKVLADIYPKAGFILQDSRFVIDVSVPIVVLSDRMVPMALGRASEVVQRMIDPRRLVLPEGGGDPLPEQVNPFDFRSQLSAAHVGPDLPGGLYTVRVHHVQEGAGVREQILLLLAGDEKEAAKSGCQAVAATRPLAAEVFKPMWNPPMHGLEVMRIIHRRRLSVSGCISYYHLPGPNDAISLSGSAGAGTPR